MSSFADSNRHTRKPASPIQRESAEQSSKTSPSSAGSRDNESEPGKLLQMQRASGNQAVLQKMQSGKGTIMRQTGAARMGRPDRVNSPASSTVKPSPAAAQAPAPAAPEQQAQEAAAAPVSAPAVTASTPAAPPAPAGPSGPASAAAPAAFTPPPVPANLRGKAGYSEVYNWLKEQSTKEKKSALFAYFDALTPEQKMSAIRAMNGASKRFVDLDNVKKTMVTGIISKSVDWDKFSVFARDANKTDTKNYNADTDKDYLGYTAIGTSASTGGAGGSATISAGLGAKAALPVAEGIAPAAGVLSGLASVSQIYNATENYDESLSNTGKAQQVIGEGGAGAADLARFSAGTVNSVRTVAGMGLNAGATVAAGAAGIVGGAAYMVSGVAGYRENKKNAKSLHEMEDKMKEGSDERATNLGHAANLGGSTQEMNKDKNKATAVKGALMVAGGAALLIAAASPAGPILIALAAILGGIAAIVKFYKKYKRKEAFVDRVLKVDEAMKKPENEKTGKDKVRQQLMEEKGFNSVGQCYAQIVTDLAGMLFESGVRGDDADSKAVIESIGLKVDSPKQKPTKEMIAKKLHT
ncbi:hypothetical protein [Paenibacillus sp. CF384]|uniref:hypothetical protein n=1 Tax=Paenibacillus sp. CF384 TaxID=1884382 RepID=UPI00089554DC|nr:hypothetical protein [Paenibacillus sp. CF384]SDX39869.1 hypothetical protein SAMN05518855_1013104 [Paenibacillus sp. CF384]